jgi:hypothetical protein
MLFRTCPKCGKMLNEDSQFQTISLNGLAVEVCQSCVLTVPRDTIDSQLLTEQV